MRVLVAVLWLALVGVAQAQDGGAAVETAQSRYDRARAAYHVERWDDAAAVFRDVLEHPHPPELGRSSASLLFDCLNRLHRHDELHDAVERYCARPELKSDRESADTCTRLGVAIDEQRAEQLIARRRFAEAAAAYLALFDRWPQNPQRDLALYNAARSWDEAAEPARATAARKRLLKLYPKSAMAKRAADELKRMRPRP